MTWQVRSLIGLAAVCLALLSTAVFVNSRPYQAYLSDLKDNRQECQTESNGDGAKKSKECQSFLYRTLDDPVAFFTAALTFATVLLFVVTFGLFVAASRQGADAKEALSAARDSARAAKASAESSVSAERAIIIVGKYTVHSGESVTRVPEHERPPAYPVMRYSFLNIGRTPAEIQEYCLEIFIGPDLPQEPEYNRIYPMVPGSFIKPGESYGMHEIFGYKGTGRERIEQESFKLVFYGFIRWTDFLGKAHETRFCARALPHYEGPNAWFTFVLDSGTPDAYTRRS